MNLLRSHESYASATRLSLRVKGVKTGTEFPLIDSGGARALVNPSTMLRPRGDFIGATLGARENICIENNEAVNVNETGRLYG